MSGRTLTSAFIALAALLLVALAPTGAFAHGSVAHPHAVKPVSDAAAKTVAAVEPPAELRAQRQMLPEPAADDDCGPNCCGAGHCAGCVTALAPMAWTCLRLSSDAALVNPDTALPASLAREGPARPPKSFA